VRESACECERSFDVQLGAVMALMNGPTVSEAISQPDNGIAKLVAAEADDAKLVNELCLRVLNRPARPEEVQATVEVMRQLQGEHDALVADLAAYEQQIAPVVAQKEQKRQAGIAAAQQAHDAWQEEIRPREEQAEKERQEKIAAAEQALAEYEPMIPAKLAAWETTAAASATGWVALDPRDLKASTRAKLEKQDDLSIFASGPNNRKGNYVVTADTDLKGITGVKLELFADSRFPANGPGRAPNGNFVLSEFSLQTWAKGKPDEKAKVDLHNARADFSQGGYDITTAIDGQAPEVNNGWATGGDIGKNRVATFECKQPVGGDGGTVLQFTLDQQFADNMHTIGRFRISVTAAPPPVTFGLPENILQIVQTAADQRSDEQKQALLDYYKSIDGDLKAKQLALADAKKPRPEDPKLVDLRRRLADASQPLAVDPRLARMQRAVTLSTEQLQNARLTAAQDLTWALINSPGFLFNR
jgi:hypothetical protein